MPRTDAWNSPLPTFSNRERVFSLPFDLRSINLLPMPGTNIPVPQSGPRSEATRNASVLPPSSYRAKVTMEPGFTFGRTFRQHCSPLMAVSKSPLSTSHSTTSYRFFIAAYSGPANAQVRWSEQSGSCLVLGTGAHCASMTFC